MTKTEFISMYLDSNKEFELIDKFSWAPDSINLENIIKESYSEALNDFTDENGEIDEEQFSFREFDNNLSILIEEKIGRL